MNQVENEKKIENNKGKYVKIKKEVQLARRSKKNHNTGPVIFWKIALEIGNQSPITDRKTKLNQSDIPTILPSHERIIFTKFHKDRTKSLFIY